MRLNRNYNICIIIYYKDFTFVHFREDAEDDLDLKSDEENRPLTPRELKKRIMKGVR